MSEPAGTMHRDHLPVAPRAAWVLLGVMYGFAIVGHEWSLYRLALGTLTVAAVALCLASARASVILFAGSHALDAYGFITHVPVSISVARIVVVAVVAGAMLRWLLARPRAKLELRRTITVWDLGVLIFLAGALVSVPFSYSLPLSVVGIVHLGFLTGAFFLLSRMALAEDGRRDIYTATIATGTLSALVALGQAFVRDFPIEVLRPAASVDGAVSAVRASAFFDNPNTMALLLVLAALFAVERVWSSKRLALRFAYAGIALLAFAGIGVSESRAALVGIVVGGVVLAALIIRSTRDRLIAVVALGVALAAMLAIPGVGERAASIVDFRNDASAMDRIYLAEVSVEMFADRPVTGVGIQAFRAAYPAYEDARVTIDPVTDGHQMPASVPAEVGILGLLAELILAGTLVYMLAQSLRAGHDPLAPAGLAALAAIAVMAFFNTFIFFESMWIAAALVGAEVIVAHRKATGQQR